MPGNIFINYRRDDSSGVAGRLHDSLAPKFGRNKLFMDVDNIPVGRDFEDYLNSQVAACDAMLAIIGPNWVNTKDESGQRRLDNPEDFVVIEIGAALTRKIPVVPVLVDGARMPKASELPDSLKPLTRRQAIQIRHTNFRSDAEGLVKRLREALGYDLPQRRWRVLAIKAVAAMAVLFLVAWAGYTFVQPTRVYLEESFRAVQQLVEEARAERERQARVAAEAEEKRKADETERQRQADIKAEQERQAKVAAEAEEKRKANDAQAGYAAPTSAPNEVKGILGLDLVDLTDELRKKHNIKDDVRGVLITAVDPNSPAAEKRLRRGHVIAEVQQERVTSATEVQQRIEKLKKDGRKVMALLIRTPDGAPSFVALRLQ